MALIKRVTGVKDYEVAALFADSNGTLQVRVRGLGAQGRFSLFVNEADGNISSGNDPETGEKRMSDSYHTYPGMSLYGEDGILEVTVSSWDALAFTVQNAASATVELLVIERAGSSVAPGGDGEIVETP